MKNQIINKEKKIAVISVTLTLLIILSINSTSTYSVVMRYFKGEKVGYAVDGIVQFETDKTFDITKKILIDMENRNSTEYIVLHSTSNGVSGALEHTSYCGFNSKGTSWHFTVDDSTVVQHLNVEDKGAHCHNPNGKQLIACDNYNSIGIEMCQNSENIKAILERTAFVVFMLKKKYPNIKVVFHSDVTGKDCPRLLDANMRIMLKNLFNNENKPFISKASLESSKTETDKLYDQFATEERVRKVMTHKVISVGIDLAQCYLETDAGKSDRFISNKNPGMCKYTDDYVSELVSAGIKVKKDPIQARDGGYFCVFETEWEGWKARKIKIMSPRYSEARLLASQGKVFESLISLQKSGYAGNSTTYAETIYKIYLREHFDRFN